MDAPFFLVEEIWASINPSGYAILQTVWRIVDRFTWLDYLIRKDSETKMTLC
jgi:hypothetical protein